MKKFRVLVLSEQNSAMPRLARKVGEMMGIEVTVEEQLGRYYGSFPTIYEDWRRVPEKWDAILLGHPHTTQAPLYAQSKTMHATVVEEGCNFLIRQEADQLTLLAHDTRALAIKEALSLKGFQPTGRSRALVIGEGSPAAAAAWACSELRIPTIEIFNGAGRSPSSFVGVKEPAGTYDLIINSMRPGGIGSGGIYNEVPIPLEFLTPDVTVLEVIYNPLETPLLKAASDRGCNVIDGTVPVSLRTLYGMELVLGGRPGDKAFLEAVAPALHTTAVVR